MDYKQAPLDQKNIYAIRNDIDENQGDLFWNHYSQLEDHWKNMEFDQVKSSLESLYAILTAKSIGFNLKDSAIQDTSIVDFFLNSINNCLSITTDFSLVNILDLFMRVLIKVVIHSQVALEIMISKHPLQLFGVLLIHKVTEIRKDSITLTQLILSKETSENEINYIIPFIIGKLHDGKDQYPEILDSLLPIINFFCQNCQIRYIEKYILPILDIILELMNSEYYFLYCMNCLKIISKLQNQNFNIFELKHDLFTKIINIIEDTKSQDFYHLVFQFIGSSLYYYGAQCQKEICEHIERILKLFISLSFEKNKDKDSTIIIIVSNLIVEDHGIVGLLLIENVLKAIFNYLDHTSYNIRNEAIYLVWNMIFCGTSDQVNRILACDFLFEHLVESLNKTEVKFMNFVLKTLNKIFVIKGYKNYGDDKQVDIFVITLSHLYNETSSQEINELIESTTLLSMFPNE
ncbi:hypothetical protein TRFO_15589 [Tritrichomonas foetus]|uniref:Uncharacterized protein n=1 Tax=Tritrichomonas foetus TaxID=1144522 RepID=A0A1J4KWF3_9EUKA|nr:hypothetical protein TRFO_15589 [Tritrichomonas foetus]|eukprot:OHT14076.1 hypothetical protein TRFO_15589 [Tritrichomonas foetus]